jgi:hypothetical protein
LTEVIYEDEKSIQSLNKIIQNHFEKLMESIKDSKYFKRLENKLMMYLGGLLNDTIYKQQKYFRTTGLLKQIVPFANYITETKIMTLYNACYRLQKAISKKEYKKYPEILNKTKQIIDDFSFPDKISQFDLHFSLISGYNLYGLAVSNALESLKKPLKERERILSNINLTDLDNYPRFMDLPIYKTNSSFQLGYLLGSYYFTIEEMQRKVISTKGLIKDLHPFLNIKNDKAIKVLLTQINLISLKLLGMNSRNDSKGDKSRSNIRSFLPGNRLQLAIFNILCDSIEDLQIDYALLGFGSAFTYYYSHYLKNIEEPFLIESEPEPKLDDKGKRIVLEYDLIQEYNTKKSLFSDDEKIAYLQGLLFNSLQYSEKKLLNTNRLAKNFSFLYRNFNQPNIIKFQVDIYHTFISLWIQTSIQNEKSNIFNNRLQRVRLKLIELLGNFEWKDYIEKPGASIALIQGYNSFNKLYRKLNP